MKAGAFFSELKRRNVLRAGVLYIGASWALAQGIAQLTPAIGLPDVTTRWFLVAAVIGFPFWATFAWFYEFTPQGLKRESEIAPGDSVAHSTGRKLDKWIIAVLALAVVLLLTDTFVWRKGAGLSGDAAASGANIPRKSVAVLPLVNESGDKNQQYFSDGLSEEMISALGQVHDLKVIGRNSSFQFRGDAQNDSAGIGSKLGVATLLEGTVRRQGDQVRIVASLIKASDGSQIWSQTYERQLKDVFAVQSDIATSVASALKAGVFGQSIEATDKPPSGNLAAYDAMLQGRYYAERRTRPDYVKAEQYYQRAIQLDPDYALVYARMAIAEQWFNDWEATADERKVVSASARAHAHMAVALAPRSATALGALGVTQAWLDFNFAAAETTLKKAVALDPSNAEMLYQLADVTAARGRVEQAIGMMRKALTMEPLNASFHFYIGQYLSAAGQYVESEKESRRALELQPGADGFGSQLAFALMGQGKFDEALAAAKSDPDEVDGLQALALIWYARGDKAQARLILDEMIRKDGTYGPGLIADVYGYEGKLDQAFAWLDRAIAARDTSVTILYEAPMNLQPLIRDPRIAAFCRKVGLPTPDEVRRSIAQGPDHE
ncbi:MAG TPA: tetratricopeptide repeat protein [Rhodanobacteraceae bacterium]|nr:tetratricopeptide repeat protein [Rhodanobacteraceae bacterium]